MDTTEERGRGGKGAVLHLGIPEAKSSSSDPPFWTPLTLDSSVGCFANCCRRSPIRGSNGLGPQPRYATWEVTTIACLFDDSRNLSTLISVDNFIPHEPMCSVHWWKNTFDKDNQILKKTINNLDTSWLLSFLRMYVLVKLRVFKLPLMSNTKTYIIYQIAKWCESNPFASSTYGFCWTVR